MNRKPTGPYSRIQSMAATVTSLAVATAGFFASGSLMACLHNAVIRPQANIQKNGSYRSQIEAGTAPVTGLSMQLNESGRFSMGTLQSGCFVAEDWGSWSSSQEELTLSVQKSMRRVADHSFQIPHDEIAQGTVWTAWEREASQGYPELERLRQEPDADEVTMDAPQALRKNVPGKDRSTATRMR